MRKLLLSSWFAILVVPLFFIGLGAAITYDVVRTYTETSRIARYVQTTGTVRATDIWLQGGGYSGGSHGGGRSDPASFVPVVWYDYTVAGRAFTGNRMYLAQVRTQSLVEAQRTIAFATAGRPLPVWYDPDNPEQAVLSTAVNTMNPWWLVVPPVFFLGISSIWAIFAYRHFRKKLAVVATAP